jgi:hypothetical protein
VKVDALFRVETCGVRAADILRRAGQRGEKTKTLDQSWYEAHAMQSHSPPC